MTELTYEPASSDDASRLADVRVRAMRESLEAVGRFDEQRARDRLLSGYAAQSTTLICTGGQLAGFYVLEQCGAEVVLRHLYIDLPFQSRGIGSLALRRIFEEADRQQQSLRVAALISSASNRFYARHGFVPVQRGEFDVYYVREPS